MSTLINANNQRVLDEKREKDRIEVQELTRIQCEEDLHKVENGKIFRDQQIMLHCDKERIRRHGTADDRRSSVHRDLQWQMNNAEMSRSQEIRYQSEVDQSLQKGHADFMQLLMNSGTQPQIAHAKMLRHQQIIRREEEKKIQEDDYEHLMHLMMIQVQQKKRAREHEELHTKQRQEKQRDVGWQHREFRRKLDDAFSRPMNLRRCR
jgi:hypothetical protein